MTHKFKSTLIATLIMPGIIVLALALVLIVSACGNVQNPVGQTYIEHHPNQYVTCWSIQDGGISCLPNKDWQPTK